MPQAEVLCEIDQNLNDALARLFEFLKIKSISTDPSFTEDCARAGDWLVQQLHDIGAQAQLCPTPGHPMVMGHINAKDPGTERHILFYGHYDVQPVDPLALWDRDPFEPAIEQRANGDVICARGASDDKGQLMTFIEACRAIIAIDGGLPCHVTFLFEGEEESGSPSLLPFLETHRETLKADIALICDTGLFNSGTPAITTMLRGMLGEEIVITGPNKDLHSGLYGGVAMNPMRVLSKILAGLHDETGRVTLPGFYDAVPALSQELAAQWDALEFDLEGFLGDVGLAHPAGEQGYSPLEMMWSRPTCEVNGVVSGYTGPGFKTVLPAQARAKISFRLVAEQDPFAIRESFRAYVQNMLPGDCTVEFIPHGASPAVIMPTHDAVFTQARDCLTEEWQKTAAMTGMGGSIPIAGYFKTILDMNSMLIGFGKDDDQIHSPNEKYDLRSFHKGIRSWARILYAIT